MLLLPLFVTGCVFGDDDDDTDAEVAEPRVGETTASPTSLASLPEGIEEVDVGIAGGEFTAESLILQEEEPTELHIVNEDDTDYRFRIVNGQELVAPTSILADAVNDIQFTTPNAAEYDGELLAAEGDEVLDTIRVIVQAPGGVQP